MHHSEVYSAAPGFRQHPYKDLLPLIPLYDLSLFHNTGVPLGDTGIWACVEWRGRLATPWRAGTALFVQRTISRRAFQPALNPAILHTPLARRALPTSKSSPRVLRNAIFGAPVGANAASCHPVTYCCITGNIVGWNVCWAPRGRFTRLYARYAREKRVSGRSPPSSLYISSLRARLSLLSPHRKQAASS